MHSTKDKGSEREGIKGKAKVRRFGYGERSSKSKSRNFAYLRFKKQGKGRKLKAGKAPREAVK